MARKPIQVLAIPFRRHGSDFEYCVFRRADDASWQFVAGGLEGDEEPIEAAKRECLEEAGLSPSSRIIALDSVASVPAIVFREWKTWPAGTYVVNELTFGIEATGQEIKIGHEHTDFRWLQFHEASTLLRWDSNRTALWELSQRLMNSGQ
jgi:dihydroneopterin triphosphate diphosphatase